MRSASASCSGRRTSLAVTSSAGSVILSEHPPSSDHFNRRTVKTHEPQAERPPRRRLAVGPTGIRWRAEQPLDVGFRLAHVNAARFTRRGAKRLRHAIVFEANGPTPGDLLDARVRRRLTIR